VKEENINKSEEKKEKKVRKEWKDLLKHTPPNRL